MALFLLTLAFADALRRSERAEMAARARVQRANVMVKIAISQAAFEAIAWTLPLRSVGYENAVNENGERLIWLDHAVVARLKAVRGPGESYSDVTWGRGLSDPARRDARRRSHARCSAAGTILLVFALKVTCLVPWRRLQLR
jgi:hypothetical protein